jgi:glycosyltransferase involved in cell wall biosynthesis
LATSVGGIPEVVEDGKTGFLTPPRDVPAFACRLLELLGDPGLRKRMGCAGRQAVETRFNLQRAIAELLKLYGVPP